MQICGDLPLSKTLEIATTRLMVGTSMSMMLWNLRCSIKCQLQDTLILHLQPDGLGAYSRKIRVSTLPLALTPVELLFDVAVRLNCELAYVVYWFPRWVPHAVGG